MIETWKIFEYWFPKVAALLSLSGSALILGEIYQDWKGKQQHSRRGISAVSRGLLSMSIGDIFFSFAWFIASWVVSQSENVMVSFEATQTSWGCRFQGFIMQLGFLSSLCFNASLAVIYLLLVRFQWPGERVTYYFKRAAGVMWFLSLTLAVLPLALDLYHDVGGYCWLSPPPSDAPECQDAESFAANPELCMERREVTKMLIMYAQILPVWICIVIDGGIMCVIYKITRKTEEQSQTNAFFGVSARQSILKRLSQGLQSSNTDPVPADGALPKARAFFGFVSSSADTKVQKDNTDEEACFPRRSEVTASTAVDDLTTQHDDATASDVFTVFSDEHSNSPSRYQSPRGFHSSTAESFAEEPNHEEDGYEDHTKESLDKGGTPQKQERNQSLDKGSTQQRKTRSRTVAVQGLWYIGGFFFTFLVSTISTIYFLITGECLAPLYRASYFFLAAQGAWNFIVFAKGRREMKTTVGRKVKQMLCFLSCKCLPKEMVPPGPSVSGGATPNNNNGGGGNSSGTQSTLSTKRDSSSHDSGRTSRPHNDAFKNLHGTNQQRGTLVSIVSNASTVIASNKKDLRPMTAASLVSIIEDLPGEVASTEQEFQSRYAADIPLTGISGCTDSEAPDSFGDKGMIGESEASVCSDHSGGSLIEDQVLEDCPPRPASHNPTGRRKDPGDYYESEIEC